MSRIKMRLSFLCALMIVALISIVAIAGCSPSQPSDSASDTPAEATEATTGDETAASTEAGAYVSDEQCMSCHGGSYEAVAELTADLGDWNPHGSIHGGYNSCDNCHAKDKEVTYNYCEQCHVYNPENEPLFLVPQS